MKKNKFVKLGQNKPKKKSDILTLLSYMDSDRWYKVDELEQKATNLNLGHSTIHTLLYYGVNRHYIILTTEETTSCAIADQDKPEPDHEQEEQQNNVRNSYNNYFLHLQKQIAKKKECEQRILDLQKQKANIQKSLEQEEQIVNNLNRELESFEKFMKENSAKY